MTEKQLWIPVISKKANNILFKWNSDWKDYNFIGGKFKEEDKKTENTVIRKIKEELDLDINTDYTFKKLTDKFRFRKKSKRRRIDCYYICQPYILIYLKDEKEIEEKLNRQNEKLFKELNEKKLVIPEDKKVLKWFTVEDLSKDMHITDSLGDIFWNISKKENSEDPVGDAFNDIPDSYDELLIKLRKEGITIGISQRALEMVEDIRKAVEDPFERPIMILGETGCGKSRLARAIHNITRGEGQSKEEQDKLFASITLAGVKDENFQCILFGYAPGSFTGGNPKGAEGLFKDTDGGTIFLDEITTIKEDSQAIFLQTLGVDFFEGATNLSFYRYGGRGASDTKGIKEEKRTTDVRIISATNKRPEYTEDKITFQGFRTDLTSRLTDHIIRVPSLNDLEEMDKSFIVDSLLGKFSGSSKDNDGNKEKKDEFNLKKKILIKLSKNNNISNEKVKNFKLNISIKDDNVKKCIFDGRYNLSWNFRSLISILAGAVDKAVKEYKIDKNSTEADIIIKEHHLPAYKRRDA